MMDPEQVDLVVTTTADNFKKLRSDESFWSIVALSRAVNVMLFVHGASAANALSDDSPAAMRARYNAVLFSCAILYEARQLVQRIGRHFKDLQEFKALSGLLNRNDAKQILESTISELRNQAVFHFDESAMGKHLDTLDVDEPVFLRTKGDTNEQVYFELADRCAFGMLHGPAGQALPETEEFADKVSTLIVDFLNAAQELIAEVLAREDWHRKIQT